MLTRRSFFATGSLALAAAGCASTAVCKADRNAPARPRPVGAWTVGKCPFRLGMAGFTYHKFKLEDMLRDLQKLDIHWLCIKDFHLPINATAAQIAEFHKKCADFGVKGYGVGPIYMSTRDEAKRAFDYAKAVGVDTVVGVPWEKAPDGNANWNARVGSRSLCEYLSDLCKEYNLRYAIHNHSSDSPKMFPDGKYGWDMVKDLDPRMGLCLDIGHEFRDNSDPADTIRRYHTRLFDVHLKNPKNPTLKDSGAMQFPRGRIDLYEVAKALTEVNYTGVCGIEYERDFTDNFAGLAESIGYFRGIMDCIR